MTFHEIDLLGVLTMRVLTFDHQLKDALTGPLGSAPRLVCPPTGTHHRGPDPYVV